MADTVPRLVAVVQQLSDLVFHQLPTHMDTWWEKKDLGTLFDTWWEKKNGAQDSTIRRLEEMFQPLAILEAIHRTGDKNQVGVKVQRRIHHLDPVLRFTIGNEEYRIISGPDTLEGNDTSGCFYYLVDLAEGAQLPIGQEVVPDGPVFAMPATTTIVFTQMA